MDPWFLEDQQVQEFRVKLVEELAAGPKGGVEEAWGTLKESLRFAQSCLPLVSEKAEEDWVTDEVREVARKKQEAWMRWMKSPDDESLRQRYQLLKRQSRQSVNKAREEWWENKAAQAEKLHESAVRLGRGGSLLKDLRLLQKSQKLKADTALLARDGSKLSSTGSKLERWREHFEQVNNISTQLVASVVESVLETAPEPSLAPGGDDSLLCVPSVDEIRAALQSMKNGRAPGGDEITSELLKLGGEAVVQCLAHLASMVWESETVPEDWLRQLTVPLHKKGPIQDCDNYRGIALLSVPGKVFCRVIQRRLAQRAEHLLRESECGVRKGRGCIDQVFALRVLAEKAREYNTPLYLSFVDLRKAYDSVNREALWMVLQRKYHLPDKLIRILKALHLGTRSAVRAYGRVSGEFGITTGVRQGDVLAPTLFNLFFDSVIASTLAQYPHCGVRMLYHLGDELVGSRKIMRGSVLIQDLEYADDMALVSDSMDALEEVLRSLDAVCSGVGLSISSKKFKILAICPSISLGAPPRAVQLSLEEEPVAVVEEFEYLGSTISQDCTLDREISVRISKAARTFGSLYRVLWCRKRLKTSTKMRLFKSVVLSTLMYGSETWVPSAAHMKRLQAFIMGCLRVILGVTRWEKKRNTELCSMAGIERVEVMVMRRRLRWLGHVERMDDTRLPKCLLVCKPQDGKRSAGGQKRRWNDLVLWDLKRCGLLPDWRDMACERGAWRGLVNEAASELNCLLEEDEERKKAERKLRREECGSLTQSSPSQTPSALACSEPGCSFVGQTKAGLVNHVRQRHVASAQTRIPCPHCGGLFHKQGIHMHVRFCSMNPAKYKRTRKT